MHRTMALAIAALLALSVLVSCGGDWIVDDSFTYTITFNGNGATSGAMEAQEVGKRIPIGLNANVFQRPDLPFRCWNTAADGSGTAYSDRQLVAVNENTTLYAQWGTTITESTTSWTDGNRYVVDRDVTISDRISVTGNVTLVLRDGFILTASKGIGVNEGNSLTIETEGAGTGELIATGAPGYSGIGGDRFSNTGTITINGGRVTATSLSQGAGIGGGYDGSVGTITINGGTINATGGDGAAGIGGGYGKNCNAGTITINGGTVTANGGSFGAGIGTGYIECNITLTINDGTITANGGNFAAGIGGGYFIAGIDVTINGGTVVATGGIINSYIGMGIGKGFCYSSDGTLTLGSGVALQISDDNTNWSDYNGTTRTRYMKTI